VNMARRTGASARTQALAKAAEAVARHDAERIAREKKLQQILADFYHAQSEVERIRREADASMAPFDAAMRDAVRALDALDEGRAGIAELTGLSLAGVREYLADACPSPAPVSVADPLAAQKRAVHADLVSEDAPATPAGVAR
jgi:ABC-type transporter Mla subunit MlaD